MTCRCVLPIAAGLAEGPCWWSERNILLWVDIEASRIGLFDPATGNNDFLYLPAHVGAVVPTSVGDLLLATAAGLMRMDPSSGAVTLLLDPEVDRPGNRFNDGKCDPWGRFWAGTMAYDFEPMAGALWRLDGDGRITRQRRQLTISNGLAWSQDRGTLYFIDSPTLKVMAFPLTSSGEIAAEPSICVQIPEDWDAVPDGMCIDAEGMLWIALFGGGAVTRWDPISGQLLDRLAVPCRQVTSCCFGGPHLDQLFMTTARREMDAAAIAAEPLAGGLFQADVGVKGLPADTFQVAA
ncbi:SMP-30/gluconolactonase/LRE family protein [Synechococcus sp. WH 8016]|uniref:SMP-30/gluconolactonase/LRE family protein n=1 Tax=Synechococcus sp. WH 8016 TaxID=166318 RepID=UPI00022DA1C4|nr:SMP-30/gluconolactonase/LRE family protein [Synechococcus sp. WH 8016]EHA64387.1 SMP-30/Gluconolaconase/LRE-like region-containing protein [Synechococcus sp. WH 8016]